jgi:hypothetical protein
MIHGDIIDMHAHVYPEGCLTEIVKARPDFALVESPRGQSLVYRGSYVMSIPSGQADLKNRLQVMDDAGVGIEVLSIGALNLGWAGSRTRLRLAPLTTAWLQSAANIPVAFTSSLRCRSAAT